MRAKTVSKKTNKLSLDEYRQKLSDEVPSFKAALDEEESYKAACKEVRNELRLLRKALHIKQDEIAEFLGVTQPNVSHFEKGEGDIGFLSIFRYAAALGMRPEITFVPKSSAYGMPATIGAVTRAMEGLSSYRMNKAVESFVSSTLESTAIPKDKQKSPEEAMSLSLSKMHTFLDAQFRLASLLSTAATQNVSIGIAEAMSKLPTPDTKEKDNKQHAAT